METTETTPRTIADLKFRMVFRSKGEAAFYYRVNGMEKGRGREYVYFRREEDGGIVAMTGEKFEFFIKTGYLTFVGY